MNLYHHYPHIYWQTACLTVNASANEDNEDNKSTNYGKVASAIGNMQSQGVKIALPDINHGGFGFTPDALNNQIIFGLKGMVGIGDDIVKQIIDRRPYTSVTDFCKKNPEIKMAALITLVKGGCFQSLSGKTRLEEMQELMGYLACQKVEDKKSLDFKNFAAITNFPNFLPEKYDFPKRLVHFRSYVCKPKFLYSNKPKAYRLDQSAQAFFENELSKFMSEGIDYFYDDNIPVLYHAKFEKHFKAITEDMTAWIKSASTLNDFNRRMRDGFINEQFAKYCSGTEATWEMDSLSFYYSKHELENVDRVAYQIADFTKLSEEPVIEAVEKRTDKKTGEELTWNRYRLFRIIGTVLDRNNNKHTVTLLTPDGVVTVKFYAGSYAHYNRQISAVNDEGDKSILEKSWFTRGTKLLLTGIRRGDNFIPKKYSDSIFSHTVCLINEVYPDGSLELITERTSVSN